MSNNCVLHISNHKFILHSQKAKYTQLKIKTGDQTEKTKQNTSEAVRHIMAEAEGIIYSSTTTLISPFSSKS